jgi:hypothetical protein
MVDLVDCLKDFKGGCFMKAQEAVQSSPEPTDTMTAWLSGTGVALSMNGAEQAAQLPGLAVGYTHLSSAMNSLTRAISDTALCNGAIDGCDASAQSSILDQLNGAGADIVSSVSQTVSKIPAMLGLKAEAEAAQNVDESIQSLTKLMKNGDSGAMAAADGVSESLVSASNLPLLRGSLGYASGTALNGSAQNTSASQSSLDLCCFGASQLGITALADTDGNYGMLVPLHVGGTNYSTLSLTETDPTTSTALATSTVDLSALTPAAIYTVPTLTPPTGAPGAGTYTETCTVVTSPFTCTDEYGSTTIPSTSTTESTSFDVLPGISLPQLSTQLCSEAGPALTAAGCQSSSCSVTASTSDSATVNLSCTVPALVPGCTNVTVTEVCVLSR